MNLKKIVSAASALTIAASAFASMAVVGHAAESLVSVVTYEEDGATPLFVDYSRTTVTIEENDGVNTGKFEKITNTGTPDGAGYTFATADSTTKKILSIKFDAKFNLRGAFSLRATTPGTGNRDDNDTSRIFTIGEVGGSGVRVKPYGSVGVEDQTWAHYEFEVDTYNHTVNFNVYDYVDGLMDYSSNEPIKKVEDMSFRDSSVNSAFAFDYYSANTGSYACIDNMTITSEDVIVTGSRINVQTVPYAKITADETVYYSNAAGVALIEDQAPGTVRLSVEKDGYMAENSSSVAETEVIVTEGEDSSVTVKMIPNDENVLYSENFNYVPSKEDSVWSMSGSSVVSVADGVLKIAHPEGAGGQRHVTKTFTTPLTSTTDGIRVTFAFSYSKTSDRSQLITLIDSDGNRIASVGPVKDSMNNIYLVTGGIAATSNTEDSPTVDDSMKICSGAANTNYDVTIEIDYANQVVKAMIGENSVTQPLKTTLKGIDRIDINPGRAQTVMNFDNFNVSQYVPATTVTPTFDITDTQIFNTESDPDCTAFKLTVHPGTYTVTGVQFENNTDAVCTTQITGGDAVIGVIYQGFTTTTPQVKLDYQSIN